LLFATVFASLHARFAAASLAMCVSNLLNSSACTVLQQLQALLTTAQHKRDTAAAAIGSLQSFAAAIVYILLLLLQ
jgi:hypothetical protein